jgi:DNA-binding NtrC family response regulator
MKTAAHEPDLGDDASADSGERLARRGAALQAPLDQETLDDTSGGRHARRPPSPALVLLWSDQTPSRQVLPLVGGRLELGRPELAALGFPDDRVSRRHVGVTWDGDTWLVQDKGSRNGTWLDGARVLGSTMSERPRVLRIGRSLFGFSLDATGRRDSCPSAQGEIIGSAPLWAAWERIAKAAQFGDTLLIMGETGSGKELAARRFHDLGPMAGGPFVAVNCAAIPLTLAEGLLFGVQRGAYSGAHRDTEGLLLSANEGTLFLDEIGELELPLQAKLLRVLETREVCPLGATRPRRVNTRVCSATHVDLASRVGSSFRADLFFRLGKPRVVIPPLRERLEEIPWHVVGEVSRWMPDLLVSSALIEHCLLRSWPGNVRELKLEIRGLVQEAILSRSATVDLPLSGDEGKAPPPSVEAGGWESRPVSAEPGREPGDVTDDPYREVLLSALRRSEGNVAEAARRLQMHRTQLRREMARYGIESSATMFRSVAGKGE